MHFLEIHLNFRVRDIGCIGNEEVTGDVGAVGDTGGLAEFRQYPLMTFPN
jgi:hypothetical protein